MMIRTAAAAVALCLAPLAAQSAGVACEEGVYGGDGQQRLVLPRPAEGGAPQRYTMLDGRRGKLGEADGPVRCEAGAVQVRSTDGSWRPWPRVALRQTPHRFQSHGTELAGMLIEPESTEARKPLVVMVHGSEKTAMLGTAYPYLLAAQGVAVFAYDKRGTGQSEGFYTQNFELLADDAAAAGRQARDLASGRFTRFGYAGFSQGGWVAPMAALRGGADFVAVGFGLVLTPQEEDQEQVLTELREAGFGAPALAAAREVAQATGTIISSGFQHGFDKLAQLRKRHGQEPWFARIRGEYTGEILRSDEADLRRIGKPLLDPLDVIWRHDGVAVLKQLPRTPILWVIAGADREAPPDVSRQRLLELRGAGQPIDLFLFPDTDHGMVEFVEGADGQRRITRVTEGYFRLLGDWMHARLAPPYGRGVHLQ
jgi:dienelactone hydrolase